jgi:hypothetical protein
MQAISQGQGRAEAPPAVQQQGHSRATNDLRRSGWHYLATSPLARQTRPALCQVSLLEHNEVDFTTTLCERTVPVSLHTQPCQTRSARSFSDELRYTRRDSSARSVARRVSGNPTLPAAS